MERIQRQAVNSASDHKTRLPNAKIFPTLVPTRHRFLIIAVDPNADGTADCIHFPIFRAGDVFHLSVAYREMRVGRCGPGVLVTMVPPATRH